MPTPDIIARNTLWWSNEVDRLEAVVASLKNDLRTYNEVIEALRSGELPWERVQVMETGQLKVLEPAPPAPDTCVEEVSKDFVKRRNGKKAEAAVAELVEVAADGD
jgi:virulence-associated protein VagC